MKNYYRTKSFTIKKLSSLLMLILCITLISSPSFADQTLMVFVEGKTVDFDYETGLPFIDANSRTQVPLRAVAEASGAEVSWDAKTRTAIIQKGGTRLDVPIGTPKIYKNGYPVYNDTTATVYNGRTYLPIRKVLELLNYDVLWDSYPPRITAFKKDEKFLTTDKSAIPPKYDLRTTGRLGEVRNQHLSNYCWAFASTSVLQSKLLPGEKYIFSPTHLAHRSNAELIYPEGGGTETLAAAYFANWKGPVLEKDYPFGSEDKANNLKAVKHVMGTRTLPFKDYDAIKAAIMEHGAVYSSIFGESNTNEDNMINYETSSQNYNGFKDLNHAVAIVGWDDNYSKDNFLVKPKRDGAFIAMNSYGTEWGDNGFYYVSYEDLHIGTNATYFTDIESGDNYDNIYTTDDYGATSWITYYINYATYANVYTPKGNETIEAVGISSMNTNMAYEIYMIPNFQGIDSFNKENAALLAKGYVKGEGYHTIKIPNSPAFNSRTAIVVSATTTDEAFKIPMEQAYLGADAAFNVADGDGYYGYNWMMNDVEDDFNSNIVLKLFTNYAK